MSAETHKQNARKADHEADMWENMALDIEEKAKRFRKYASQRRRDAADYRGMAEREDRAVEQILSQIGKAA